ncbi:MAG TPA: hypothetical protein VN721_03265 [Flavipsychrobacter sp.]|nr:hypothetical protein [Flavipsychrobacter sp.]
MNLYVSNISPETSEIDLRQAFSEFGEVVGVKIVKDIETGMPRGFGFVEMADKFSAFDAIDNLDCTFLKGQIIAVKEAKPRANDRGQGGYDRGNDRNNDSSGRRRITRPRRF